MLAPYFLGGAARGRAVVVGGNAGDGDGGFVDQPVVTTTASGNTTVKGKVKPGSFGKFVYPLAVIAAGRQYTFRYTPHFAQLAQQGKLAMVGFGLKNGNDFHIVGLRGDGSTGVHKYKVNGTPPNGWNAQTGHTTSDGGAAANGTQAGPNYIRLVVSADGATYTFQTSPDGSTWTDEYTAATPSPFSNVSGVATFGIALWFNNADAGPFSIDIDQFADAVAPVTDPSFSSVKMLLGFNGTDAATTTADESSAAHGSPTFAGNAQLDTAQFKFGASSLLLDGSGDYVQFPDSADWFFGTGQFTIEGWFRFNAVSGTPCFIGQMGGSDTWMVYLNGTSVLYRDGNANFSGNFSVGWTPSTNTWYHIAVDRDVSNVMRVYIDGAMRSKVTFNINQPDTADPLTIGTRYGGASSYDFNGWVDEVRITKGAARYGSDAGFTVPTAAFPRS
ncbi:LamG domain-containing protein [Mesorhizobium sp. CO1-1-9]|uniref:LamG domain-containing protein n=1 Tax=Mesorhizobium sp. CO1-1-9 TaxID=2876630 RepID=UPI001CCE5C90|nr:LamG domain-containing protein [Mesorhizobium sp. CO1-1-9]MBZ9695498.1 LamG domain-containing protein [Mesorhizobium sp. CO1-1-9]